MSLFRKFFGGITSAPDESDDKQWADFAVQSTLPVEELFSVNFKKNGGKFLYCEDLEEVKSHFEDILEENDWFESEVLCNEPNLFNMLDDNKLHYSKPTKPIFLFATCENLVAEDGAVLFSSNQIKQSKPHELPSNIIIMARTSQIIGSKSDGLTAIKRRYEKNFPSNITTIKYFEKAKEETFLHYGSVAKNLYLLLLEDL